MTDISARQTFTTAGNTRLSDNPGSADTPESGRYIEAHALTRPTGLLADRRNCVTMGRRKARPRGRENYPRQTNHIRAIRPPPGSPRVEFGASFVPARATLRPHRSPTPHSALHSLPVRIRLAPVVHLGGGRYRANRMLDPAGGSFRDIFRWPAAETVGPLKKTARNSATSHHLGVDRS